MLCKLPPISKCAQGAGGDSAVVIFRIEQQACGTRREICGEENFRQIVDEGLAATGANAGDLLLLGQLEKYVLARQQLLAVPQQVVRDPASGGRVQVVLGADKGESGLVADNGD